MSTILSSRAKSLSLSQDVDPRLSSFYTLIHPTSQPAFVSYLEKHNGHLLGGYLLLFTYVEFLLVIGLAGSEGFLVLPRVDSVLSASELGSLRAYVSAEIYPLFPLGTSSSSSLTSPLSSADASLRQYLDFLRSIDKKHIT